MSRHQANERERLEARIATLETNLARFEQHGGGNWSIIVTRRSLDEAREKLASLDSPAGAA